MVESSSLPSLSWKRPVLSAIPLTLRLFYRVSVPNALFHPRLGVVWITSFLSTNSLIFLVKSFLLRDDIIINGMAVPLIFGLLTFCLSIFTPSTHWAGETPASKKPLLEDSLDIQDDIRFLQEETVSIAVQHEQPISEAPSNLYVITDEDIRKSGAIDLPTVLRRVPGMEVIQMAGADFNVSVRGNIQLRANKLLVMVDGRSIYLDVQGEVLWKAIPVTLPEIKRIEVLKGPASALYGLNAFDSIINIITKSPEEMIGIMDP